MNFYIKNKIPFLAAVFLLLPLLNRIMETGPFFLLFSVLFLGMELWKGEGRKVFDFSSKVHIVRMAAPVFLSALGLVLKLTGVIAGKGHTVGEYLIVFSIVILYPFLKEKRRLDKADMQIPVFIGLWILALYLLDTALFPEVLSLFDGSAHVSEYINMTAFLVVLLAAGLYLYSDDRVMRPVYIAGMAVAALVIGINEAWGTAFLIFVLLVVHSVTIVPVAETMKRLLFVFFGLALIFCNMSLLVNYTGILRGEVPEYRLECSLVGELFLCLLALYVFRRWDKIPEGVNLQRIKLNRLQRGCRCFWRTAVRLLPFFAMLSLIDGKLAPGNLVQLFAGENWEKISADIFVISLLSIFRHMYESLRQLWEGNLPAAGFQMYGWPGFAAALAVCALLCRRLYQAVWKGAASDKLVSWTALGLVAALIALPVTVYMLPVYLLFAVALIGLI